MNDLLTALGVLAESCLIFYRSVLNAGGSDDEACLLTSMYMDMCVHGGRPADDGEEGDEDDD